MPHPRTLSRIEWCIHDCETVVMVLKAEVDSSFMPKYLHIHKLACDECCQGLGMRQMSRV